MVVPYAKLVQFNIFAQQRQTNKELPGPDVTQLGGKTEKHATTIFNEIKTPEFNFHSDVLNGL